MRRLVPSLACVLVAFVLVPVAAQADPAARTFWDPGDSFVPTAPVRVLDTRAGIGVPAAPVTGGIQLDLSARVPTLATAVVLNLTGTEPTAATNVRVSPVDYNVPEISNLNLVPGETRANQVTVALPEDRKIFLFNNAGSVQLIADLAGYYTPAEESRFTSTPPTRLLDTRAGAPVGPGGSVDVDLSGRVPAAATSVTFNLTGTAPTAATYVTAHPSGGTRPTASNLNLVPGQTSPNLVTVALGATKKVTLFNNAGTVHLIVDLAGFYATDRGDRFFPVSPVRAVDTRDSGGAVAAGDTRLVDLATRISPLASAAVVNLTGTGATENTFVTAYPTGSTRPLASNLNLAPRTDTANAAVVALGGEARMTLFNNAGSTHLVVDVAGFFANPPYCVTDCLYAWGGYWQYGPTPGIRRWHNEVKAVVATSQTALALHTDGTVWSWGDNQFGQLGAGGTGGDSKVPLRVSGLTGVTQVAAGFWNGFALKSDGTVWSWGEAVGLGSAYGVGSNVPVRVWDLTGVTAIAAGDHNGYALRSDGTVWAWGSDVWGGLGDGTCPIQACPYMPVRVSVPLPGTTRVTAIAAGRAENGYALRSDGTVWAWGRDWRGETGTGAPPRTSVSPSQVVGLTDVVSIAGGDEVGYAVRSDGTVWAWGDDYWGQLGTGTPCTDPDNACRSNVPVQVTGLTGPVTIVSGYGTTLALKPDGTVWAWGRNSEAGDLGTGFIGYCTQFPLPATCRQSTPVQANLAGVTSVAAGGLGKFAVVR